MPPQRAWRPEPEELRRGLNWPLLVIILLCIGFWIFFAYGVVAAYHDLARKLGELL
jgi:hypothetical protein